MSGPTIFLVATEESGDRLGAPLIRALRERLGASARFVGVGGSSMAREGLTSLIPIAELAIVGVVAVAQQLPLILRRIREVTGAVLNVSPDVLVIIDSPDFTHRVARRVRRKNPSIPIVNYVSPTVWAWRPGRAKAMRKYVDHVLALLPFEPKAHEELGGPPCTYVGHPLFQERHLLRPSPEEAARRLASPPVLLVLPGSRRVEIRQLIATFGATLDRLRRDGAVFEVVLPTVPHVHEMVVEAVRGWGVTPRIVATDHERRAAFRIAHAALAKSGTVTLELAIAGVPMVAAYRGTAIESFIARRLIRTSTVILANLVLGENIVPEFMQDDCVPDRLAPALRDVMNNTPLRLRQTEGFTRLDRFLSTGDQSPSERAAAIVIAHLHSSKRSK